MGQPRSRRTIAFLVRGLEPSDTYNRKHWAMVYDLVRAHRSDLLMVAGHVLDDPHPFDRAHAAIFRLLNRGLVDAALLSTTVTYRTSPERLEEFDRELGDLPVVTMSVRVGQRPHVSVDNSPGLADLMRHLITVHGCRRIVHVRGPYPNEEAAHREQVWRSELERAGIVVRPEWLVPGGFEHTALRTIGRDILDRVGTDFDAVVACNDIAAHRVIEDLTKMGYQIPRDFAVCGFDDIEKSRHSLPPLTTVRQPLDEVTKLAWRGIDRLLHRRQFRPALVPTTLVVRASCGCAGEAVSHAPRSDSELLGLINGYEQTMERFQASVYDLHNFIRAMNRVTEPEQLVPILHEWLPRLGVGRFAVLRTCGPNGEPREHVCQWNGQLLPTAPDYFAVLTAEPAMAARVIPGSQFSLDPWLTKTSPFVFGLFPLVTGDIWYGLAVLELSRSAGLLELTLQEQLASTLDRIAHEKKFRETETLRRYAAEVAEGITAPLDDVTAAHQVLEDRLSKLAEEWMPFVTSLSERGRTLLSRLYDDVSRPRGKIGGAERRQLWTQALDGLAEATEVADDLERLGYRGTAEELLELAKSEDLPRIAAFLSRLSELPWSTATLGSSAETIAEYVNTLRRSLL
jgi:DNA-binding LacI/PurR family transcriptional regulator